MTPYLPHQERAARAVAHKVTSLGLCLLAGLPRVGKTRSAIRAVEILGETKVLVVTPKAAIPGWLSEIAAVSPTCEFVVTNFEQLKHFEPVYKLVIVDECHRIGRVGKPSLRFKELRRIAGNSRVILSSGTAFVETHNAAFYQFTITRHSPFAQYANFYKWWHDFGLPQTVKVQSRFVEQYTKSKPTLAPILDRYTVTVSQDDAGIKHQAEDKVHVVELSAETKRLIATVQEDNVIEINGEQLAFESDMAVRVAVHQLEYGALKVEGKFYSTSLEVVDYLKATFGDSPDVGFMTHFHSTRELLAKHFKHASMYSSQSHSEGVNLAHLKHFVVINTGYSGASHCQRRERIVNLTRTTAAVVHHITTDAGISADVYRAVSRKKDFNMQMYRAKIEGWGQKQKSKPQS